MKTQDLDVKNESELYALDPDFVTQPAGQLKMTRTVFASLVALRVYLIALIVLVGYRFAQYAHFIK